MGVENRSVLTNSLISMSLWFAAFGITYRVDRRLALALVLWSLAMNLSEWVREASRR